MGLEERFHPSLVGLWVCIMGIVVFILFCDDAAVHQVLIWFHNQWSPLTTHLEEEMHFIDKFTALEILWHRKAHGIPWRWLIEEEPAGEGSGEWWKSQAEVVTASWEMLASALKCYANCALRWLRGDFIFSRFGLNYELCGTMIDPEGLSTFLRKWLQSPLLWLLTTSWAWFHMMVCWLSQLEWFKIILNLTMCSTLLLFHFRLLLICPQVMCGLDWIVPMWFVIHDTTCRTETYKGQKGDHEKNISHCCCGH